MDNVIVNFMDLDVPYQDLSNGVLHYGILIHFRCFGGSDSSLGKASTQQYDGSRFDPRSKRSKDIFLTEKLSNVSQMSLT